MKQVKQLVRYSLLLALSAFSAGAYAVDCNKPNTQADMNQCAAEDLNKADGELNQLYIALRAQLNVPQQNQIRDVQLAWIKYRDLSCRFESAHSAGGSAQGMVLQYCLTEKTKARAKELKSQLSCGEGDISCVK
jgi:uncharacterized protein YecT (DUF1311 family)